MNNLTVQKIAPIPNTLDDLVTQINQAHDQVEKAVSATINLALEAGELLLKAKSQLAHGEFEPWVTANFEFSNRMARAYMRVAKKLQELPDEKRQRVADKSLRELIKLFTSPRNNLPKNSVISLAEVEMADLVAELETRDPHDAEQALLMRVRQWVDADGDEIIVCPKKAVESETAEQNSTKNTKDDPLFIPPSLDRRNETPSPNHEDKSPTQLQNKENKNV
jgi:hypothetical protein